MSGSGADDPGQVEEASLDEPRVDSAAWDRWRQDQALESVERGQGLRGLLKWSLRRALNPLLKPILRRQTGFNIAVIDHLEAAERSRFDLLRDLRQVRGDLLRDVQNNHRRISHLEAMRRDGFDEVMRHSDTLYAVVDQKLDRYRREALELRQRLGALLAKVEEAPGSTIAELAGEWNGDLEHAVQAKVRRPAADAKERLAAFEPLLPAKGTVLDLTCADGELLASFAARGWPCRGFDSDAENVEEARRKGLEVEVSDPLAAVQGLPESSVGALLMERADDRYLVRDLGRLVRLAWLALEPGGCLILESSNPLSLSVAGRDAWRLPGRERPLHPEAAAFLLDSAGFVSLQRIDLSPFAAADRLPELSLDELPAEQHLLADRLNRIRDDLDRLLFGYRTYAMVGRKAG